MREPNGSCFCRSASAARRRWSSSYARRPSSARALRAAAALTLTALRETRPPREPSASDSSWSAAWLIAFRWRSCSNCLPGGAMSGCQRLAMRRRASWTSRFSKGGSSSRRRIDCSMSSTAGMNDSGYRRGPGAVDHAARHVVDRQTPCDEDEGDQEPEVAEVDQRLEAERRVVHELDGVEQRVD